MFTKKKAKLDNLHTLSKLSAQQSLKLQLLIIQKSEANSASRLRLDELAKEILVLTRADIQTHRKRHSFNPVLHQSKIAHLQLLTSSHEELQQIIKKQNDELTEIRKKRAKIELKTLAYEKAMKALDKDISILRDKKERISTPETGKQRKYYAE